MTYTPAPRLEIAGVDYSADTLSGVTLTRGRVNVWEQPQPGYVTATLVLHGSTVPIELEDRVRVYLNAPTGPDRKLFTGYVTDVVVTLDDSGALARTFLVNVVAVGNLALLARGEVGVDGYPAELDGDRIRGILIDGFATRWDTTDPTERWTDLEPDLTWANLVSPFAGEIDTGVYELAALDPAVANAYELVAEAANAGDGVLIERVNGRVDYEDATRRQARLISDGYTTVPAGAVLAGGLTTSVRLGEVVNRAWMSVPGEDPIRVDNNPAQRGVGILARSYSWPLANVGDAEARGERIVSLLGYPRDVLERFQVPLHALEDAVITDLLDLDLSEPIELLGLPDTLFGGGTWRGFVEGITITLGRTAVFLELMVSDEAFSIYTTRWADVADGKTWAELGTDSPTLEWVDAYGPALEAV